MLSRRFTALVTTTTQPIASTRFSAGGPKNPAPRTRPTSADGCCASRPRSHRTEHHAAEEQDQELSLRARRDRTDQHQAAGDRQPAEIGVGLEWNRSSFGRSTRPTRSADPAAKGVATQVAISGTRNATA